MLKNIFFYYKFHYLFRGINALNITFINKPRKSISMEIKVLENTKHKLVIEVPGEDHTLFNILTQELVQDKEVKLGGYLVEHPVINIPRLIIETKTKSPVKVLQEAIKNVRKLNDTFVKAVDKALK